MFFQGVEDVRLFFEDRRVVFTMADGEEQTYGGEGIDGFQLFKTVMNRVERIPDNYCELPTTRDREAARATEQWDKIKRDVAALYGHKCKFCNEAFGQVHHTDKPKIYLAPPTKDNYEFLCPFHHLVYRHRIRLYTAIWGSTLDEGIPKTPLAMAMKFFLSYKTAYEISRDRISKIVGEAGGVKLNKASNGKTIPACPNCGAPCEEKPSKFKEEWNNGFWYPCSKKCGGRVQPRELY